MEVVDIIDWKGAKVSKTVDISQLKPGEAVHAVLTESLVVEVTK